MKSSYKLALLAALGLASVSAVQAQNAVSGDLIVGVYQPGAANTEVVDLGAATSLTDGETWNLSSALSGAGITLSSTAMFGVAGDVNNGDSTSLFYSTFGASNTHKIASFSAWNSRDTALTTVPLGSEVTGSATAWDQEVQPVNSGTLGAALGYNIDEPVTGAVQFWSTEANNASPAKDGTFTLNTATDVLTYNGITAVPEPSTYGLLAGAGLLVVSLRNQFRRKQV